ncbi:MAG: hypothetical protein H8E94_06975 [Alphaproteobacteria bacterium]|nr:hypothetical protein [Alphaproteobacteria bacterium]
MNVTPGDVFLKLGNPPTEWTVERIIEYPDIPPHVQLQRKGYRTATMTIALSVLIDRREFQFVPTPQ